MVRFERYFAKYLPGATRGDPGSLTMLAIVGACAAGVYIYDKLKNNSSANNSKTERRIKNENNDR